MVCLTTLLKTEAAACQLQHAGDTAVSQADLVPDLRSNQTHRRFPLHGLLSAFLQEEKADMYNLLYLFEVLWLVIWDSNHS